MKNRFVFFYLITPAFLGIALVAMWKIFHTGLDFSDESLYLLLSSRNNSSVTLWGPWSFYTHILYRFAGGNIFVFRYDGGALLLMCALALGGAFLELSRKRISYSRLQQVDFVSVITISMLYFYGLFLMSPGYNWLALVGITVSLAALIATMSSREALRVSGSFALGIGVVISTMGRPLAGPLVLVGILLSPKLVKIFKNPRMVFTFLGGTAMTLLLHSLFILNLSATTKSWTQASGISHYDQSHSFSALLQKALVEIAQLPGKYVSSTRGVIILSLIFAVIVALRPLKFSPKLLQSVLALLLLMNESSVLMSHTFGGGPASVRNPVALSAMCVVFALTYFTVWAHQRSDDVKTQKSISELALVAPFIFGIIGYSFTSNNGMVVQSSGAGILYVLILLIFSRAINDKFMQQIMFSGVKILVIVSISLMYFEGIDSPYRSAPTHLQNVNVLVGPDNSPLKVDTGRATEISQVRNIRNQHIVPKGALLVDLTPFTSYVAFEVGFNSYQLPLLINQSHADAYASNNARVLRHAWLLTANSKDAFDPAEVTRMMGMAFPQDYILRAEFNGKLCRNRMCTEKLWSPKIGVR